MSSACSACCDSPVGNCSFRPLKRDIQLGAEYHISEYNRLVDINSNVMCTLLHDICRHHDGSSHALSMLLFAIIKTLRCDIGISDPLCSLRSILDRTISYYRNRFPASWPSWPISLWDSSPSIAPSLLTEMNLTHTSLAPLR